MPDLSFVGAATVIIKASLSNNLRLVTSSGVRIKILDKAPKGFYMINNQITECPEGSYCTGKGYESAIRCPIGTYVDKKKSDKCKP